MAIEARVPSDQPKLLAGLKKLSQADPAVLTMMQETGETVICTAGELHAERCIRDLEERFAKVKIQKGSILVPYRETIVSHVAGMSPSKIGTNCLLRTSEGSANQQHPVHITVAEGAINMTLQIAPLPKELVDLLLLQSDTIRKMTDSQAVDLDFVATTDVAVPLLSEKDLLSRLQEHVERVKMSTTPPFDSLRAFGPRGIGPNILFAKGIGSSSR